jgi:hypothetical protein
MAEVQPPSYMQNRTDHSAQGDRQATTALLTPGRARKDTMVVNANGTPNMSVNVGSGLAFVPSDATSILRGLYLCYNNGTTNLAIEASHSTLARKDTVIAQVLDGFYSGSDNKWQLRVLTGTAASTPTAPSAPANAIRLATIEVLAGATSITSARITNYGPLASVTMVIANDTERTEVQAVEGQQLYQTSLAGLVFFDPVSGRWHLAEGVRQQPTAPPHYAGRQWYDTDDNRLRYSNGAAWIEKGVPKAERFYADGTWTKPVGARFVRVRMVGGGGAGGGSDAAPTGQCSAGEGGGGGAYLEEWYEADDLAATRPVVVGAGGNGVTGGTGGNGGNTTFNGRTAFGGKGGSVRGASVATYSGAPGALGGAYPTGFTVDSIASPGSPGGPVFTAASNGLSGFGGASGMGGAGGVGTSTSAGGQNYVGQAAVGRGGGGGGAITSAGGSARAGGDGLPGFVVVESYF